MKKLFFCLILFFAFNTYSQTYTFIFTVNGGEQATRTLPINSATDYRVNNSLLFGLQTRIFNPDYSVNVITDADGVLQYWGFSLGNFSLVERAMFQGLPITFRGVIPSQYFTDNNETTINIIDILHNGVSTIDAPGGITPFKWWDKNLNGIIDGDEAYTTDSYFKDGCPNLFIDENFDDVNVSGWIDPGESRFLPDTEFHTAHLQRLHNIDCTTGDGEDPDPDLDLNFPDMPGIPSFDSPTFGDSPDWAIPQDDREVSFLEAEGVQEFFDRLNINSFDPGNTEDDWGFNLNVGQFQANFDGFDNYPIAQTFRNIIRVFLKILVSILCILAVFRVLITW